MSKDEHNQESRNDEIWGEWRQEVEGQRGVLSLLVRCLGSFQGKSEVRAADV